MDGEIHNISKWDLIIAHPPCTYLTNAGARHLYKGHKLNEERYNKLYDKPLGIKELLHNRTGEPLTKPPVSWSYVRERQ